MTSSPSLIIRIGADASGATQTIQQTTNHVQNLGTQVNHTSNTVNNYTTVINQNTNAHNRLNQSMLGAARGASTLSAALGSITAAFGARELIKQMDSWASMEGRLKLVTQSTNELRQAQEGLSKIAQTTRSDLEASTNLYFKIASATKEAGKSQQELMRLVETTNKAIIISGSNAVEAKNAILQFGQALSSDRLGGDELRSMAEQTPRLVMAIRDGLGLTTAEFKKLAEASGLTTEVVTGSLEKMKDRIDKEFGAMPVTIGQSFTLLGNAMTEFIGKGGQANGAADTISGTVQFLAKNFAELAKAVEIAAGGYIAYKTAAIAAEIATLALNGAMLKNPIGAMATAIGAATGALFAFREESVTVGDKTATVGSIVKSVWESVEQKIKSVTSAIDGFFARHETLLKIHNLLTNMPTPVTMVTDLFGGGDTTKGIIDRAAQIDKEKAAAAKKIAEENDKLQKELADSSPKAASGKVTPEIKKAIEDAAAQNHIDYLFIQEIIRQESRFKMDATSPKGAAGLMQVMPITAKQFGTDFEKVKNDYITNIEVGTKAIVRALNQAKGEKEEALARYNWGEGNVNKSKAANHGVFELSKMPAETRNYVNAIMKTYKDAGGDDTDKGLVAFYKEQEQAAKHATTVAEQEARKQKSAIDKMNDNDPLQRYIADMNDLRALRDKLSPETYLLNEQKIAAQFEKSTVGIEKLTAAERERQRVFDGTARGKFEKGMEELRAQKQFMSEGEYASKQDKINVDYLKESGQKPDAKTEIETTTAAAKKYEEQIKKTTTANYELGNSGKMAFDGLLGGISAVASAFTDFSSVMEKNSKLFAGKQQEYDDLMKTEGATEKQKAEYTAQFSKERAAYNSANLQAEIAGARSIAGATAKMFGEKSAARKAFHAVEMGLAVVEMAMTAKKMIVDLAAGAAAMFGQSGWGGFAGVAAMAAVMAGLGFAMSGGSDKAPEIEYGKTTGTVLGDSEAQSHSVKTITDALDEIHAREYPELKKIVDSVRELNNAQDSMLKGIVRTGGIKLATAPSGQLNDNSGKMNALSGAGIAYQAVTGASLVSAASGVSMLAAGLATAGMGLLVAAAWYALSKIPVVGDILNGITSFIGNGLFGKVTKSVVGGGIRISDQNLGSLMDDGAIDGNIFTVIETKKKSWFKTTRKYSEVLSALGDEFATGLGKVILSMAAAVGGFWEYLGKDVGAGAEKLREFVIPAIDIKTYQLKDTEIQDALKGYTSMAFDKMVEHMVGAFVEQFQKLGETAAEAMGRVMTETVQYKAALTAMGADVSGTNESMLIFTQSMANMAGGIKNLISLTNEFTNKFTSADKKAQISKADIQSFITPANAELLKQYGLGDMKPVQAYLDNYDTASSMSKGDINELKNNLYDFGIAIQDKAKSTSDANSKYSTVAAQSAHKDAFEHNGANKAQQGYVDLLVKSHTAWANLNYNSTTADAKAMEGTAYAGALTTGDWGTLMNPMFAKNDAVQARGITSLQAQGLPTSESAFDAAKASAGATTAPLESLALSILSLVPALDNLGTTIEADSSQRQTIEEQLLKAVTTPDETTERTRAATLDAMKETGVILRSTLSVKAREQLDLFAKATAGATLVTKDSAGELSLTNKGLQKLAYWAEDGAKSLSKFKDASKTALEFAGNISGWVNNQKVTQLGSTKTQLDAAGAAFDALMLRINVPTNAADKKLAMGQATQTADAYIGAIKNFYGSSKAGTDLVQGVIDKVKVLPDSVSIQQLMLDKLEEIRAGIVDLPTFGGVLTPENTAVIEQLAADIKDAVDRNLTAPTLQAAQALNAQAQVMLTLQNISAATNTADGVFVNKLITAIGSNTGLASTLDMTIKSTLDSVTKQAAIDTLTNSLGAIEVSISKYKANPTAANMAQLQADISAWTGLIANVSAKVTAFNANPNDPTLKAGVQDALNQINSFSAKIAGLTLSQEAINAANTQIGAIKPPAVSLTVAVPQITIPAIDAVISAKINEPLRQAAINALVSSFAAIEANITKFNATPSAAALTKLQADIASFGSLTANVVAKVTDLSVNPNDPKLKEGVQKSIDAMSGYTAKISNLAVPTETLGNFGKQISDTKIPDIKVGIFIPPIVVPPINAEPLTNLGKSVDGVTLSLINMTGKLTALGAAQTSLAGTPVSDPNFVGPVNQALSVAVSGLTGASGSQYKTGYKSMVDSDIAGIFGEITSDTLQESYKKLGKKKTNSEISAMATKLQAIVNSDASVWNKNLSFVLGYNETHPDNQVDTGGYQPTVLNLSAEKSGSKAAQAATKDASGKPILQATIEKTQLALAASEKATAEAKYKAALASLSSFKSSFYQVLGYNEANPTMKPFAKGGAFTNGIVSEPTTFNMGLMGEAGSEGILPLHNINGSLGVKAILPAAANDSNATSEEEIAELKRQNQLLIEQNAILQEGFLQLIAENKAQNKSLNVIKTANRERAYK